MTLGPDRMMYADGFLLPHGAACFQDKLCYPFSCLLIYLKRQSYRLLCQQVGWHLFLIPVSASEAAPHEESSEIFHNHGRLKP